MNELNEGVDKFVEHLEKVYQERFKGVIVTSNSFRYTTGTKYCKIIHGNRTSIEDTRNYGRGMCL